MISQEALHLYMRGMEIHTLHYDHVKNIHLKLVGLPEEENQVKYCLRSNRKPRKIIPDELSEKERQLLSNMLRSIRDSMRFELTRNYTIDFTSKYINSFEDLLQYGRYMLTYIYENKDTHVDTATGVEASLYNEGDWPILQMIELNDHIFTHTSTNFPCRLFQEMFVIGYIPKINVEKIETLLKKTPYKYKIGPPQFLQPSGIEGKDWLRDMIELTVEDPQLENRNLYIKLLALFKEL